MIHFAGAVAVVDRRFSDPVGGHSALPFLLRQGASCQLAKWAKLALATTFYPSSFRSSSIRSVTPFI